MPFFSSRKPIVKNLGGTTICLEKSFPKESGRLELEVTDSSLYLSSVLFSSLATEVAACILMFVSLGKSTEEISLFSLVELFLMRTGLRARTPKRGCDMRVCVKTFLMAHQD